MSNSHFYSAASNLVKDQLELPEHLSICFAKKNENECVTKNPEVIENLETINNDNEVKIRWVFFLFNIYIAAGVQ